MISSGKLRKEPASSISVKRFCFFGGHHPVLSFRLKLCTSRLQSLHPFLQVESQAEVENGHEDETKGTFGVTENPVRGWGLGGRD